MRVERYKLSLAPDYSVFDGDIFQPIWYNWSYDTPPGYLPLEEVFDFYSDQIRKNRIAFPDLYIILQTSDLKLIERKQNDATRRRRNFKKHLKLVYTQTAYFKYLKQEFPNLVVFIQNQDLYQTRTLVQEAVIHRTGQKSYSDRIILDKIQTWILNNKASQFIPAQL